MTARKGSGTGTFYSIGRGLNAASCGIILIGGTPMDQSTFSASQYIYP
ncbi:MAG: hypothetical protein K5683_08865 [Prevotella sp.]|nr:hypothetical protein [Prevotella sp.]